MSSEAPNLAVGMLFILILLSFIASFGMGLVMIVGALRMMRLKSYGWAMTASILALLPCSPAGIIGLVMGIWSLVVLSRSDVRAAFAAVSGRTPQQVSAGGIIGLVLVILLLLLATPAVLLAGYWLLSVG
jgi:hypothetical protein